MPNKDTKGTHDKKQNKNPLTGAFYDLFHPSSQIKLIEYSEISSLIDFNELKLINIQHLKVIKTSDMNLIDKQYLGSMVSVPTVVAFSKYAGTFALSFALVLSLFSGYTKALNYAVVGLNEYASNYYDQRLDEVNRNMYVNNVHNIAMASNNVNSDKVRSSTVVVEGNVAFVTADEVTTPADAVAVVPAEVAVVVEPVEIEMKKHLTVVRSIPETVAVADTGTVAGVSDVLKEVKAPAFMAQLIAKKMASNIETVKSVKSVEVAVLNTDVTSPTAPEALVNNDERVFRVYELNENPKELVYKKETLTAVNVDKIATEPVCSFTYGSRKLASGANLNLNPNKEAKLYVDYRNDAHLSTAIVGANTSANNERVEFIDLSTSKNGGEIEVQVMNSSNEFIGSCKLSVGGSTLAAL